MEQIREFASRYLTYFQFISVMDVVEIIIISIMMYYVMVFIRNTRAWALLKGVFVIMVFLVIAEILKMDTILWIARSVFSLAVIALICIVIVVLEKLFRRKLKESVLNVIMLGSFALVIGLMLFATFNDVSRLF